MASDQQLHRWLMIFRCALIVASAILSLVCVLSGVRPGWVEDCYLLEIEAFQDAARGVVGKIPGVNRAIGAVWDEVMAKLGVPEVVAIYTTGYCSAIQAGNGGRTIQCSSGKASDFDIATAMRVALVVLYAVGITFSLIGMASPLVHLHRRPRGERRHHGKTLTSIAFASTAFASLAAAVTAYAVYMVLSENLPESIVAVRVGGKFFALTWSASICLALSLAVMHVEESGVGTLRHCIARIGAMR